MASIKRWGVVTGGAVAGAILVVSGLLLGLLIGLPDLAPEVVEGNRGGPMLPLLLRVLTGFVVVWVYVAFRPRFGAGRRAVVGAAVALWIISSSVVVSATALFPILPPMTVALIVVWSLIDLTAASSAGAMIYRRHAGAISSRKGRSIDTVA